jgi:sulfatase modifying factor 1
MVAETTGAVGGPAPAPDMVWIPAGTFMMGSDSHYPEEAPAHKVSVDGFWIDRFTVTNRQFAQFVAETSHVTVAEQAPDPADYPGAKPEMLIPASTVFVAPTRRVDLANPYNWWTYVPGADWRHPQGPGSSVKDKPEHPVVQLTWADVHAFSRWAGKQLPSEAEWEYAARGGLDGATYAWGEELTPANQWMANTWQGEFPIRNTGEDGHAGTAPVGSYPPNGYGLYDMIGNVWEWTTDWYQPHAQTSHSCCSVQNPHGGHPEDSFDPALRGIQIPRRVMKGGSHLCAPNYCRRYRPAARMPQAVDTATSHLGFRCISRA